MTQKFCYIDTKSINRRTLERICPTFLGIDFTEIILLGDKQKDNFISCYKYLRKTKNSAKKTQGKPDKIIRKNLSETTQNISYFILLDVGTKSGDNVKFVIISNDEMALKIINTQTPILALCTEKSSVTYCINHNIPIFSPTQGGI